MLAKVSQLITRSDAIWSGIVLSGKCDYGFRDKNARNKITEEEQNYNNLEQAYMTLYSRKLSQFDSGSGQVKLNQS
jgi:hypothetical protein